MNESLMKARAVTAVWAKGLWQDKGMALSLAYVFLPVLLFFFGWLHLPLALLLGLALLWLFGRTSRNLCTQEHNVGFLDKPEYWIVLCVIAYLWVWFSGIGGFSFQNSDFNVKNPVYRDLVNQPWPVFFDFSSQREAVQAVLGSDTVGFVYYFCFWLPPALLSKLFPGNEFLSNVFLQGWTYLGILLVLYQIHRYLKHCSWAVPGIFIFFSGFDAIGYRLLVGDFQLGDHLEWWCTPFQYSSNTTALYFVFNQAIPVWLVVLLLLNMRGNGSTVALSALIFPYSPFATVGMVPMAVYSVFRGGQKWKKAVTWENILMPVMMLLVFGSFYLSNPGNVSEKGWIFQFYPLKDLAKYYPLFILLEVGIYAIILRKCLRKYDYLWLSFVLLAVIPLYRMGEYNDFAMRASLPCLTVLSVCLARYVLEECQGKWRQWGMVMLLVVAAAAPLSELYRSVSTTAVQGAEPVEWVYSFQDIATDDEYYLGLFRKQYFAYDPEKTFFFHYLAKGN